MDMNRKFWYLFLLPFWLMLEKVYFWKRHWVLGCVSTQTWYFPDIFYFLKILSLELFAISSGNSCIKFFLQELELHFTCDKSNLQSNLMNRIVIKLLKTIREKYVIWDRNDVKFSLVNVNNSTGFLSTQ